MVYRPYDSERDKHQAMRIWQEVNWLHGDRADELDRFIVACGGGWVAEVKGEAECLVLKSAGDLRYLEETLPFSCITGVTTSRVARKLGLAGRLTAVAVAHEAMAGAAVAGLCMFEQGYYDRLGFGTGTYEHTVSFNPGALVVDVPFRIPERISKAQYAEIHDCRLRRRRGHGSVSLAPPEFTLGRMEMDGGGYGLGYRDEPDGAISHMVWWGNEKAYHGPLHVRYLLYQTGEQLLELLALLKAQSDQILSVRVYEPADIQLQDLIRQPFSQRDLTAGGSHAVQTTSCAWWQMRICDLAACLAATHLEGPTVRLNLALHDPIDAHLPDDVPWRGITGEYMVTMGPESTCEHGMDPSLPVLEASVNAFTRLWLGVRPASGLAVTDELSGPPELLAKLDRLLCLPRPSPDWDM